jgi:TolB-like protein
MLLLTMLLLAPYDGARAQNANLQQAIDTYNSADFDGAIDKFLVVARNTDLDKPTRKVAMEYLGRAYSAKRMNDEARAIIKDLLDLEPPLYEPDPDVEPKTLVDLYYEVRHDYVGSYEVERADPGLQTMAIVDFTNNSITDNTDLEPLRQGLADLVINQLNGATGLKVIERDRLQWLLGEIDIQQDANRVDQETAVRAGKLLGATTVLFGSYLRSGKDMHMTARLVKVETGEILMTTEVSGRAKKFYDLAGELSKKVASAINVTLSETKMAEKQNTKSLDAMLLYAEGLKLLEQDSYEAAYEKFLAALDKDKKYERARLRAESTRLLILEG